MTRNNRRFRHTLLNTASAAALGIFMASGLGIATQAANAPEGTATPASAPAKSDANGAAQPAKGNGAAPADADQKAEKAKVPDDVVKGLIAGTPAGMDKVKKFLYGEKMDANAITDRGIALVNAVRNTPEGQDPQRLLEMSQKVSEAAKTIFQSSTITKVSVDRNFKPQAGDKAWKFGPRDADKPAGFEMVSPEDTRLRGVQNMRGIHRPGTDPLTSSGIIGVRNFESELPNGEWRVIMITDDLGEPETAKEPFGSQVQINNTRVEMGAEDPSQWLERAYLTNKSLGSNGGPAGPGGATPEGLGVSGGVVAHQAAPPGGGAGTLNKDDVASNSAGAVTMQANVNEQHLGVGWASPKTGGQETYIVAIIAEPASRPPSMTSSTASLDMEGKIFNQAVNLTQPPKAGQPVVGGSPPPPGLPPPPGSPPVVTPPGSPPTASPPPPGPPPPPTNIPIVCGTCSPSNS